MTLESQAAAPMPGQEVVTATGSDDDALGAAWDQIERDNGAARASDGTFASPDGEGASEDPAKATEKAADAPEAEKAAEEPGGQEEAPAAVAQPLPANWVGMDAEWAKIPADIQEKVAKHQAQLHARMSDQGRQIGELRPVAEAVSKNRDLFEGRQSADGKALSAQGAMEALFAAQRGLERDPVASLLEIADMYGARDKLAQALGQNAQPQQPGFSRADAERVSREEAAKVARSELEENRKAREGEELIGRLSKDKPLFSEIDPTSMVFFVTQAKGKLGEAASSEAVFNLAYDMAINADPALRAKAAPPKVVAASKPDPKRTDDAKRAAGINLTSTSTGKGRQLTEDELLGQAFDRATEKG